MHRCCFTGNDQFAGFTALHQVGELRAVRDELTAEVSCLEQQLAALKAQLDEKEQR